jgi:hypothetical protein
MTENYNSKRKEKYSADASHVKNIQMDMENLYFINMILLIIYYVLLIIFVFLIFTDVKASVTWIKETIFIALLFLYPIIIFPIQNVIYQIFRNMFDYFFQNIYLSKTW